MSVRLYVEGGGDHNKALQTLCRRGFSEFVRSAGVQPMPRIVACGGRRQAYESFRTAHEKGGATAILLVDSEGPLQHAEPWEHVRLNPGDGWEHPHGASADQLQFMTQAMEAWFHADHETLALYYGQNFRPGALSRRRPVDDIPKADLFAATQGGDGGVHAQRRVLQGRAFISDSRANRSRKSQGGFASCGSISQRVKPSLRHVGLRIHQRIRFQKLQLVQPLIDAAAADQLVVRARLRHAPVIQHHDAVRPPHR